MKKCEECKYCIIEDTGYSNWTVEGFDFTCAKNLHPDGTFDRWYGEDKRLEFADKCSGFEAGDSIKMDVDHDEEASLTPEQKKIWDEYRSPAGK